MLNNMGKNVSCIIFAAMIILFAAVCGCTQNTVAPPREAKDVANVTAERMLLALNTGNYTEFTQNFSPPMARAVNESVFNDIRGWTKDTYGDYISKTESSAYEYKGFNNFEYNCKFSKGYAKFRLTMNSTNISMVEGEHFI